MAYPTHPVPDPRAYVDYRHYLVDAIYARFGSVEDGAHLDFARAANCSDSHLTNILNGHRDLQGQQVDSFAAALDLKGDGRSMFLLLTRRNRPQGRADAAEIERQILDLREVWIQERKEEAARHPRVPVPPHPAVASHRQDGHNAKPDPAIALGFDEALRMIDAEGRLNREFRVATWTVPEGAMPFLIDLLDTGASEIQMSFFQAAAEDGPLARRYAWQAQFAIATEPVLEDGEVAAPLSQTPRMDEAVEDEEGETGDGDETEVADDAEPTERPPSVFDFLVDPHYLTAWVDARKRQVPAYTVGRLALKLKANASYLYQILGGRRTPDADLAEALSKHLGHTPDEHLHLLRLIRMRTARSNTEVEESWWEIVETLARRGHAPPAAVASALVGLPALSCLAQLAYTSGFREDPRWLGRHVDVSPRRAALGLTYLETVGALRRWTDGRLVPGDAADWYGAPDAEHARRTTREWIRAAQRAASRLWRPHLCWRVDGPLSVASVHALIAQASALHGAMVSEMQRLEAQTHTAKNRVVQLQFQVFPQLPPQGKRLRRKKSPGE